MAASTSPPLDAPSRRLFDAEAPLIVAHRGASRLAPENTLAAFDAAIAAGADAVELDVRRTRDGVLVVHHASQRRRMPVASLTYLELVRRSRHRPPRLEEVAQLCSGRIAMDVELKQRGHEDQALALLAQRFSPSELLITSFNDGVVRTVKRLSPGLRAGLILGPARLRARSRRFQGVPVDLAERCGADFLVMHRLLVRQSRRHSRAQGVLSLASAQDYPVFVWTVNSPLRLVDYLSDRRVTGIITDLPDVAVDTRRRLGLRS